MTVVVMREGYIARMAAVSQNQFDSFHQWLNLC
jgi:hypothetical protein